MPEATLLGKMGAGLELPSEPYTRLGQPVTRHLLSGDRPQTLSLCVIRTGKGPKGHFPAQASLFLGP